MAPAHDRAPVEIALTVNGRDYRLCVEPRRTLLDAIRDDCGLTGTHMGCEHGVCGACTVLLDGDPVRACLIFAVQAEGSAIRTVEGLAEEGDAACAAARLHRASRPAMRLLHTRLSDACRGNLEREPDIGDDALLDALSSNLCRCTGYRNIVAAVHAAFAELRGSRP